MIIEYEALEFIAQGDVRRPSEGEGVYVGAMIVTPSLIEKVKQAQIKDPKIVRLIADLVVDSLDDCPTQWRVDQDGSLRMGNRLVVLIDLELRKEILQESHRSRFTIHPGGTKMYRDMKRTFWWEGMKREVAEFVSRCVVCQMVKAERRKPPGLL
jgi:hypothetical protein